MDYDSWITGYKAGRRSSITGDNDHFTFMGYDVESLAKIIKWYETEEGCKMTREDAINKLKTNTSINAEQFVDSLIALGMLKVDDICDRKISICGIVYTINDVAKALSSYGYSMGVRLDIVQIDNNAQMDLITSLASRGNIIIKEIIPK